MGGKTQEGKDSRRNTICYTLPLKATVHLLNLAARKTETPDTDFQRWTAPTWPPTIFDINTLTFDREITLEHNALEVAPLGEAKPVCPNARHSIHSSSPNWYEYNRTRTKKDEAKNNIGLSAGSGKCTLYFNCISNTCVDTDVRIFIDEGIICPRCLGPWRQLKPLDLSRANFTSGSMLIMLINNNNGAEGHSLPAPKHQKKKKFLQAQYAKYSYYRSADTKSYHSVSSLSEYTRGWSRICIGSTLDAQLCHWNVRCDYTWSTVDRQSWCLRCAAPKHSPSSIHKIYQLADAKKTIVGEAADNI